MIRCNLCGAEFDARDAKCAPACPVFDACKFTCCPNCGYMQVDPARAVSVQLLARVQKLLKKKEERVEKNKSAVRT